MLARPEKEDAEFLTDITVGINQMKRFRFRRTMNSLKFSSQHLHVRFSRPAANRQPHFPPVAVHIPHRRREQRRSRRPVSLALQRDPQHAAAHFPGQRGGGHGQLEEEERTAAAGAVSGGLGVCLDAKADFSAAAAEQGAGDVRRLLTAVIAVGGLTGVFVVGVFFDEGAVAAGNKELHDGAEEPP
nr:hypothetical protein Iba_chr02aCG3720 [Ipomoea batatas]